MAWQRNIPNYLTYFRIGIIPFLILAYLDKSYLISAGLFLAASITDWLDGYVARLLDAQSAVGRFLDPIADKLLVATALILLVADNRADAIPAIAIVCREILVSGLREFLAEIRVSVPVSRLAKYKTAIQMTAIFILLLGPAATSVTFTVTAGKLLLWIAAILTLFTGYAYFSTGWKHLNQQPK